MQSAQREALRLFVVGATGGIGRVLVQQAKERGHRVTAFARSPEKLASLAGDRITVRRGDPLDPIDLQVALPNHDAVLSALGAPGIGHTTVHQEGARSVLTPEPGQRAPVQPERARRGDALSAGPRRPHALPDARVVYVAATGATTVHNLAYAQRLARKCGAYCWWPSSDGQNLQV